MHAARSEKASTSRGPRLTTLLGQISAGKQALYAPKGEIIFSQGDHADAVYFVQFGRVKISVVSHSGKEAVLVILGSSDFFGEECLIGQSVRMSTATVLEASSVFPVQKSVMLRALHAEPELAQKFTTSLVQHTIDLKEDLCDQLFNQCEKRLARVLLKLARLREQETGPGAAIPTLSHETLAEMVGTTRSRVTHFMNKFRRSGLIDYDGHLIVVKEPLTDLVLTD
jgi:CRP-like cAMP-binding protein